MSTLNSQTVSQLNHRSADSVTDFRMPSIGAALPSPALVNNSATARNSFLLRSTRLCNPTDSVLVFGPRTESCKVDSALSPLRAGRQHTHRLLIAGHPPASSPFSMPNGYESSVLFGRTALAGDLKSGGVHRFFLEVQ